MNQKDYMATEMTQKDYMTTKINPPQRWPQKDEKGRKTSDFGAYRTQKAGFPRKLAMWIGSNGFSYMHAFKSACTQINAPPQTNSSTHPPPGCHQWQAEGVF